MTRHELADVAIAAKLGIERSSKWPAVEEAFRAQQPNCQVCGEGEQLNVHHMLPFHYVVLCGRPDLELDPRNLLTICTVQNLQHHVLIGHLDDYESYNPDVLKFVLDYHGQAASQIRGNSAWQTAHIHKPKHVDQMTQQEKAEFKKMLDVKFIPNPAIVVEANKARVSAPTGGPA